MMLTIHKYPFDVSGVVEILMPQGAEVLHVAIQNSRPCIWAIVDPEKPKESRRFRVFGTGQPIESPPFDCYDHVATFQAPPYVWHLFTEPRGNAR